MPVYSADGSLCVTTMNPPIPTPVTFPSSQNVTNLNNVPDLKTQAILENRMFVASTNIFTVGAGSFLNVKFANAANSGKKLIVTKRRFDNNVLGGQMPVSYGGIASPADIVAPTISTTGSNLTVGGPTSTAALFTAKMEATRINNAAGNAVPTGSGYLPTNGEPLKLEEWRTVPPGTSFSNFIVG